MDVNDELRTPAPAAETEARFIDRAFLRPHESAITGEILVSLRPTYGIEPLWALVVLGAETSLGDRRIDPKTNKPIGGRLVYFHNYGCMKAGRRDTKWGELANGTVKVGSAEWFTFPTMEIGIRAWGRYIKIGPTFQPRYYIRRLRYGPDWRGFAEIYYGDKVAGFEDYVRRLERYESYYRRTLEQAGFPVQIPPIIP